MRSVLLLSPWALALVACAGKSSLPVKAPELTSARLAADPGAPSHVGELPPAARPVAEGKEWTLFRDLAEPTSPGVLRNDMATFDLGGFLLAGAEYWPYAGASEPRYPEDVLWGFYPKKGVVAPGESDPNVADATPAAVACAEKAFTALQSFLRAPPGELSKVVEAGKGKGFTNRFYLWVNDYSLATSPFPQGIRPSRLWYWKRKTSSPPKPDGYWKWEATLTQDGVCHVPEPAQIHGYLKETLSTLR